MSLPSKDERSERAKVFWASSLGTSAVLTTSPSASSVVVSLPKRMSAS